LPEVSGPPEPRIAADQELSPPDTSVSSIPGAVENYSDKLAIQPVLGHAGGHVGMMVLDCNLRQPGQSIGDNGRTIIGVEIMGHDLFRHSSELFQPGNDPINRCQGRRTLQVAYVAAHESLLPAGQADRGFQLPAKSQDSP